MSENGLPVSEEHLREIGKQSREASEGLLAVARLRPGQLLVVGCSTSEVVGRPIGTAGNLEVAHRILEALEEVAGRGGVYLAVQCCEHLNRSLVVEEEAARHYGLEEVLVYPVPGAGGALAGAAMERFRQPVVVAGVAAHAGLDIGDTLIGMHLKPVAVPVRLGLDRIGKAHLTAARTRPRLVGGARAVYRGPRTREDTCWGK